jgi:hypothetical protein
VSKRLKEIIKKKELEFIDKHLPAKDAPVLSEDEQTALEAFVAAYDKAWEDTRDNSRNIENDGFHASSLGVTHGKCARRNVYLLRGVEKMGHFPPRILRVFQNGHDVHERTQNIMEGMGIEMESEIPIEYELPPIRGHADGILTWQGRRILLEIKSCSDEVFVNRLKWKKPKDDHFDQANIYAYILGLDIIWVLYENKNTQEVKIFEKAADPEKAEKIIDAWWAQWLVHQDGELPIRPYKVGSSTCGGCDLKYMCYGDEEVGVDIKPYKKIVKELRDEN